MAGLKLTIIQSHVRGQARNQKLVPRVLQQHSLKNSFRKLVTMFGDLATTFRDLVTICGIGIPGHTLHRKSPK